jgi:hypothetical protein
MAERSRLLSLSHWLSRETHIMWTEKSWGHPNYSIFDLRKTRIYQTIVSTRTFGTTILEDHMDRRFKTLRRRQDHCWVSVTVLIIAEKWKESYTTILVLFQRLELLRNKLRFTWGRAKVLPTDHIVQNWAGWPDLRSSLCPYYGVWREGRGLRSI